MRNSKKIQILVEVNIKLVQLIQGLEKDNQSIKNTVKQLAEHQNLVWKHLEKTQNYHKQIDNYFELIEYRYQNYLEKKGDN